MSSQLHAELIQIRRSEIASARDRACHEGLRMTRRPAGDRRTPFRVAGVVRVLLVAKRSRKALSVG